MEDFPYVHSQSMTQRRVYMELLSSFAVSEDLKTFLK